MNVLTFLLPHLPPEWKVEHTIGTSQTNLGKAQGKVIPAVHPGIKWSFTENEEEHTLRLNILDAHGHVDVEIDDHPKDHAGVKGGFGNMGGASAIIKCTYEEDGVKHEFRFEGKLVEVPF